MLLVQLFFSLKISDSLLLQLINYYHKYENPEQQQIVISVKQLFPARHQFFIYCGFCID